MFVMQVPYDEADDKEWKIDDHIVCYLVEKSKPDSVQSDTAQNNTITPLTLSQHMVLAAKLQANKKV